MNFRFIGIIIFSLLIFTFGLPPLTAYAQVASDWPTFQQNPQHTGFNSAETVLKPPLSLLWKIPIKQAGFVVSGNLLYANTYDSSTDAGILYAFDLSTKQIKWQKPTHGGNAIAVSNGVIYAGELRSYCGNICTVTAYDDMTGDKKWSSEPINGGVVGLTIADNIVFIGSHSHQLQALDAITGETKWIYYTADGLPSTPAVHNGVVYIGSYQSGGLYALNTENGHLLWNDSIPRAYNSSPSIADNMLYIGSGNGVRAYDILTKAFKWNALQGMAVNSTVAAANGIAYAIRDNGNVYALNANSGNIIWDYQPEQQIANSNSAIVANGVVYVGEGNDLIALDALSGELLWSYTSGGKIFNQIIANNKLFFFSQDGYINALGKPSSSLNVPYFSQNEPAPIWGESEYDSAYSLGAKGMSGSMNWWGCAITSIAMILNYHNINHFVDGTSIDPGTLNNWLKAHDGFYMGYDKKGEWYSWLDWSKIGSLTAQISTKSGTPNLEWERLAPTKQNLENELFNNRPPIIKVKNASTNMHFVVAKGIKDDTYSINDPEWNYPDLINYSKNFHQLDSFRPSYTNLSYITIAINPGVEILVTDQDQNGLKTGKLIKSGIIQSYDQIPDALYGFEEPISNPGDGGELKSFGTGVNSFILPKPDNDNYKITLSSQEVEYFTINISATQKGGDYIHRQIIGTIKPNDEYSIYINYSQDEPSIITNVITFDTLKSDLQNLFVHH